MAAPEPQPRRFPFVKVLIFCAVVVLGVMLARRLDLDRVLAELLRADWRLVALAALLNLTLNTAARVGRWSSLLDALPRTGRGARFGELCALYVASQAASNLLPARAGEALRVVQLQRRHGYTISGLVAVLLVEAIVAAVTLGSLALLVTPLAATPASLRVALVTWAVLGPGGALGLLWLAGRTPPETPPHPLPREGLGGPSGTVPPSTAAAADVAATSDPPARGVARIVGLVRGFLRRMIEAVRHLNSPRVWARSLGWSLLSDLTDVLMIGLVLAAVGVVLSPANWIVAFVAINLVLIIPTTPAQLGVLEFAAVGALGVLGVDSAPALAFAILYHAAHVVPPTVVGGLLLLRVDLRRRVEDEPAA